MAGSDDKPSRMQIIAAAIRGLLGGKPGLPPGDPYAYTMAPLRRGPKGRSGAAVAEIEDDSFRSYPPRHRG